MKDNLSIVITMLVFVILIVIFPLYNYFERQDDMSYNLALKATTNFVDEVLESGYLDQEMYNKYVSELANTGNIYDIQLEAHRKVLIKENPDSSNTAYNEKYLINYNNNIFDNEGVVNNIQEKVIRGNAYYFNEGDKFYVKMKNSNTTMAGAIFNTIVPTASKDRISVNYGGIVKNQAWSKVDATYRGHATDPDSLVLECTSHPDIRSNMHIIPANASMTFKAKANVTDWWGKANYTWEIIYSDGSRKKIESAMDDSNAFNNGILNIDFRTEEAKNRGFITISAYAQSEGKTIGPEVIIIYVAQQEKAAEIGIENSALAKGEISSPDKTMLPTNVEVSEFTFSVDVSNGHSGEDYWRIIGIKRDGTQVNLTPTSDIKSAPKSNGSTTTISGSSKGGSAWGTGAYSEYRKAFRVPGIRVGTEDSPIQVSEPGIVQLKFEYLVTGRSHVSGCLVDYNASGGSNVRYTIGYRTST